LESMDRCDARTSLIWLCARWAMNSCKEGGRMLSLVPSRYQLGRVSQAGSPEGSRSALKVMGRCATASYYILRQDSSPAVHH
jgi:hypothetical protein